MAEKKSLVGRKKEVKGTLKSSWGTESAENLLVPREDVR